MNHSLKVAIVVALLIVVVFIVVHPLVDLDPTVLRHLQTLILLLIAVVLAERQGGSCCRCLVADNTASLRKDSLRRIDLTSTWLC
jgi:hypothetical protein